MTFIHCLAAYDKRGRASHGKAGLWLMSWSSERNTRVRSPFCQHIHRVVDETMCCELQGDVELQAQAVQHRPRTQMKWWWWGVFKAEVFPCGRTGAFVVLYSREHSISLGFGILSVGLWDRSFFCMVFGGTVVMVSAFAVRR